MSDAKGPLPLVIANARARRVRGDRRLLPALRRACSGRARLEVTRSLGDLREEVSSHVEAARSSPGAWAPLILVGGDGTHMAGASALTDASGGEPRVPVALAAGGTVSTTAMLWGSSGDAVKDVERALSPRPLTTRPTLSVEDDQGRRHTGFIWGTALIARFFELYDATGGGVGPAARLVARLVWGAATGSELARRVLGPMPMRIRVDGRDAPGEGYSLAVAAVHRSLGLGFRVTYRAGEDPSRIHLVASRASLSGLARNYPRTLLGLPLGGPSLDELAARIEVCFLEESGGSYVMDGDSFRAGRVALRPGPSLQVVAL